MYVNPPTRNPPKNVCSIYSPEALIAIKYIHKIVHLFLVYSEKWHFLFCRKMCDIVKDEKARLKKLMHSCFNFFHLAKNQLSIVCLKNQQFLFLF
jgi:hypothetical protein